MVLLLQMLFQMVIAHAVSDFVLQNDAMGAGKNRTNKLQERTGLQFPPWYYWLLTHALVHGGAVYFITGNLALGLIETALHTVIDFGKCEHWYGIHVDQALHILCKLAYVYFILQM